MQAQSRLVSGSAVPWAPLPAAGASRRVAAARPGPGGRSRGLAPLPPPPRPALGLHRRRDEGPQLVEGPWATPEKQQLHSGEPLEAAEAAMRRYPWHSDEWKEEYRRHLRVTFDFQRWRTHRSAGRYWRHMASLVHSNTVQGLARPLAYVLGVSAAVAAYHAAAAAGHVPLWPALRVVANAPFSLASFALSLLLVFRTNASYGRWDEARKMWGSIVNRSRDLVRQGLGYIHPRQPELRDALCRWTIAYSRSLMCHLREGEDLEAELRDVLPPEELQELLAAPHRPNHCCQVLTEVLREAQLPGSRPAPTDAQAAVPAGAAYRMDENLTLFCDVVGGCERLLKTPIPLQYTRHTSRFMMIWLTLLPFTLWESCGWAMLPVIALVAFTLLGIEEIGVAIEEPFSILPLEAICRGIEDSVRSMAAAHRAWQGRPRRWARQPEADLVQHGARHGNRSSNGNGNGSSLPAGLFASQPATGQ